MEDKAALITSYVKRGAIQSGAVSELCGTLNCDSSTLLLLLIDIFKNRAYPTMSGFPVGAAGLGASGAIYLGVNIEFDKADISQTIHAEQATIINAYNHGEKELSVLAVTAPPCGFCRQFLYELNCAKELKIILANSAPLNLIELLPHPFGPEDLDIEVGLLSPQSHGLTASLAEPSLLTQEAVRCANHCYAPYTKSFAGAAVALKAGEVFSGSYIENAAFNPSLGPLKSALSHVIVAGHGLGDIRAICIATVKSSKIDHIENARALMLALPGEAKFYSINL